MDFELFYEDQKHSWMQSITPLVAISTIGEFMAVADFDNSGFITEEEFYKVYDVMGPWAEDDNASGLDED